MPFYEGLLFNKKSGSIRSAVYMDKKIVNTAARKDYILDKGWAKFLAGRWKRDDIVNRLKDIPWLRLQEEAGQNPLKISYYYDIEKYNYDQIIKALGTGWYKVNIIPSHGKFIDIIPKRASKGNAIKFLCRKWAIEISLF